MHRFVHILVLATVASMALQACSKQQDTTLSTESQSIAQQASSATTEPSGDDTIEMDTYHFKLAPEVQLDGIAHMDFYVHDQSDKHLKGVTGTFQITKPDGTKVSIPIKEEEPNDHYHGMIKMDQAGEYTIVAQVSIGEKKYNQRFSFQRKL